MATSWTTAAAILCASSLLVACSHEEPTRSTSTASATPPAASTPAPVQSAAPPPASAALPPPIAVPEVTWDKTFHAKRVVGDCTFEFDAPEDLRPANLPAAKTDTVSKDGCTGPTCFTLDSKSFQIIGYAAAQLDGSPEAVLSFMGKDKYRDVLRVQDHGVVLGIVMDPKGDDRHAVRGHGGEPSTLEHPVGCVFSCEGPRDRLGDVVKICKSGRITVKPSKKK